MFSSPVTRKTPEPHLGLCVLIPVLVPFRPRKNTSRERNNKCERTVFIEVLVLVPKKVVGSRRVWDHTDKSLYILVAAINFQAQTWTFPLNIRAEELPVPCYTSGVVDGWARSSAKCLHPSGTSAHLTKLGRLPAESRADTCCWGGQ